MRQHVGPKLFRFVLFNDSWGLREGTESEKVIFYDVWDQQPTRSSNDYGVAGSDSNLLNRINQSPSTLTFDPYDPTFSQVLKDVGFAEAMIKFVTNFGCDEQLSSVHGCRVRLVMEQVEPHFWICCTLLVPKTITAALSDNHQQNDNQQHLIEYHEDELNDHYVRLLISQIHETFCLFNGSLQDLWNAHDQQLNMLRSQCSHFFQWFLATIQLFSINLLYLWGGMSYLPIDNLAFLEAQCFIQQTLAVHSRCRGAFFLYNDQLVFSSLSLKSTATLYRYLVSVVLPEVTSEEMSETFRSRDSARTRFVRAVQMVHFPQDDCPSNQTTSKTYVQKPKKRSLKYDRQLMTVYRSNNGGTVVLLLEPNNNTEDDSSSVSSDQTIKSNEDYSKDEVLQHVLERLHTYMASRLPDLVSKLAENSIRLTVAQDGNLNCTTNSNVNSILGGSTTQDSSADQLKFAYFNVDNAAYKSNCGLNGQFDHRKLVETDFVRLILDVESELRGLLKMPENLIQLVAKTTNDSWLVVNESDSRTLYTLLNNKNANLIEAFELSQSQMSKKLRNILFI